MNDAEIRERYFRFLEATESEHELAPPASPADLASLPAPLRPFYQKANGAALFDGDLLFFPARGASDEDGTVQHASRLAREAEWHVPQDVVLFARETDGEVIGLWTGPRDEARCPSPVVLTGLIFEPAAHSLLATSIERYLITRIVWECLGTPFAKAAFDAFQVPKAFQVKDLEDLDVPAWFQWADPALKELPGDPYEEPLTAEEIADALR